MQESQDSSRFFSEEHAIRTDEVLSAPEILLPLLFDSDDSDFVVYTCDLNRRFRYLSNSAIRVFKMDPAKWYKRNYLLALTDNPCNDILKNSIDAMLEPGVIQKLHCEIYSDGGGTIRIEIRRRLVVVDGYPVGVIGVAKRAEMLPVPLQRFDEAHHSFQKLTVPEREVIDMVVGGEMNKKIAKQLGIALRTVESRRSRAMSKLGVKTVQDLVRLWQKHNSVQG
ncbi:MAG: LuxR C-terminal-related transcriptional regulator [Pirellula sp.]